MRWDNLKLDRAGEEEAQLPGYRDAAVVRRFDAPEALDTRFYEVRAKSVLNRVPESSAVPFRWTVNPYRGCSHACTYCASPATPVLLANGRTKPIADLVVGEQIVGTERRGAYRRYVTTEVEAHWQTMRRAYRTVLEDGTELVTSGDHRFLTNRGWKHVIGTWGGPGQRPHLTLTNELLGTGRFARPPEQNNDYRRGYVTGLIRGDAHLASPAHERSHGRRSAYLQFRLALTDVEALHRARDFLSERGIGLDERVFQAATAARREMRAIASGRRVTVDAVVDLVRWPLDPSDDWRKGFLAGIFDAEGSCSGQALRIHNTDPLLLRWTAACLAHLGFDVVEDVRKDSDLRSIRILGGLRERLRFFHLTDPAITRKRTVQGTALKSDARTRVVAVEPLGLTMPMVDITTGTGDFIANGVVSHNCFARPTHRYLDMDAGRDFEREIVVKVNAPEVLRVELSKPRWTHEHVALGTNTDPYQWVEGRYRLMPGIWEAFRDTRTPCSVLTKSPLLLRDLPLMQEIAARGIPISANLSVPTLDEKAWRATEPHTPHPRARLEAVGALNRAGIPTGVLVAPLMPGINDAPEQVEPILELAYAMGATSIGGIALHLRGETKDVFFAWLRADRPDLVERYEELYRRGAYAPKAERDRLAALLRSRRRGPSWPVARDHRELPEPLAPARAGGTGGGARATQESLF